MAGSSKTAASVRYASRVTGVPIEKYLVWGAIGAAVYFVAWPVLKTAFAIKGAASDAMDSATNALSSGLYRVFGPKEDFLTTDYAVTFPDGSRHAVPSNRVNSSGVFINLNLSTAYKGDGKTYRLLISKVDKGKRIAVRA